MFPYGRCLFLTSGKTRVLAGPFAWQMQKIGLRPDELNITGSLSSFDTVNEIVVCENTRAIIAFGTSELFNLAKMTAREKKLPLILIAAAPVDANVFCPHSVLIKDGIVGVFDSAAPAALFYDAQLAGLTNAEELLDAAMGVISKAMLCLDSNCHCELHPKLLQAKQSPGLEAPISRIASSAGFAGQARNDKDLLHEISGILSLLNSNCIDKVLLTEKMLICAYYASEINSMSPAGQMMLAYLQIKQKPIQNPGQTELMCARLLTGLFLSYLNKCDNIINMCDIKKRIMLTQVFLSEEQTDKMLAAMLGAEQLKTEIIKERFLLIKKLEEIKAILNSVPMPGQMTITKPELEAMLSLAPEMTNGNNLLVLLRNEGLLDFI